MKLLVLTLSLVATTSFAQLRQLTKLETTAMSSADPQNLTLLGSAIILTANSVETGRELWIINSATQQANLLKDIKPGHQSTKYSDFTLAGSKLYFFAVVDVGYQLWVTDGTSNGTKPVSPVGFKFVQYMVAKGSDIYFLHYPDPSTLEVWKSDGTASGTKLIKGEIAIGTLAEHLTVSNNLVYFTSQDYSQPLARVWRTDGTSEGTFYITDLLAGDGFPSTRSAHPNCFLEYKNNTYFIARSSVNFSPELSVGIVKVDGTAEGTEFIKGIYDGDTDLNSNQVSYGHAIVYNDKMYFSLFNFDEINSGSCRLIIWESDGTAINTRLMYDETFTSYFSPSTLFGRDSYLYFTTGNADEGTSLVKLDITDQTVEEVQKVAPSITPQSSPSPSKDVNELKGGASGTFYLTSNFQRGSWNIWSTDGTSPNTKKIDGVYASYGTVLKDDKFYFIGHTGDPNPPEVWVTRGTLATTTQVPTALTATIGLMRDRLMVADENSALMVLSTPETGTEPWITDGTPEGTHLVKDLSPGTGSSNISSVQRLKDGFVFTAWLDDGDVVVVKTDGTEDGTSTFTLPDGDTPTDIAPGPNGSYAYMITLNYENNTGKLFRLNWDTTEPLFLKSFELTAFFYQGSTLGTSKLFFLIDGMLWESDGTAAGTVKLADGINLEPFVAVGNKAYGVSTDPSDPHYKHLYRAGEGTEGAVLVKDFGSSSPQLLTAFNDKLVFNASDSEHGNEVWISDGTEEGTHIIKDIYEGAFPGFHSASITVMDDSFYFTADNGQTGVELYRSNGTPEGTMLVKDILPGAESSTPASLTVLNINGLDLLCFSAFTPSSGIELWTSNGTAEGTSMYLDVIAGPASSDPSDFHYANSNFIFSALTESDGVQLMSYHADPIDPDDPGDPTTGLEDEAPRFVVYPNPSTGPLYVQAEDFNNGARLEIYSMDGRCVMNSSYGGPHQAIDLANNAPGIYVIRLTNGTSSNSTKILKR